jgi:hypothetical protein
LLARLRDEAHRFANHGRTKQVAKRTFRSELDAIPGIGAATRRALHGALGSMREIRMASDEAILAVPGVTRRHLAALRAVVPKPSAEGTWTEPVDADHVEAWGASDGQPLSAEQPDEEATFADDEDVAGAKHEDDIEASG